MRFHSIAVLYDGECPICRNFASYQRLAELADTVNIVDMRTGLGPYAEALREHKIAPSDGVIVALENTAHAGFTVLSGVDAVHFLAGVDNPRGIIGWLNTKLRSYSAARKIYPWLFRGRLLLLKLLRIDPRIDL